MKKISVVLAGICGYGGLYLKEMLYGELGKTIDITYTSCGLLFCGRKVSGIDCKACYI